MHSWLRGPKIPPILPTPPPFSNFVPTPFPPSLLPSTAPPPTHTTGAASPCSQHLWETLPPLLILLSCFFGRMGDHATFDVLFYLMISWM